MLKPEKVANPLTTVTVVVPDKTAPAVPVPPVIAKVMGCVVRRNPVALGVPNLHRRLSGEGCPGKGACHLRGEGQRTRRKGFVGPGSKGLRKADVTSNSVDSFVDTHGDEMRSAGRHGRLGRPAICEGVVDLD